MNLSKVDMVNENNNEVEDKSSNLSKVDITNENNNETEEKSSNNLSKVDIANENNENTNIDVETQNKDDEALYFYSSGDIAAAKGNPEFQYIQVIEEYPSGVNPYAGNGVFFSGEYDKVN